MPTYEELKIKIKQLEAEIVSLKYKQTLAGESGGKTTNNFSKHDNMAITKHKDNIRILEEKHAEEVKDYQEKLLAYNKENESLKDTNTKLENLQNELFGKLKTYNKEIGDMKSIYDSIKQNLEEEGEMKRKDILLKLTNSEKESKKLKEKIKELIEISETQSTENFEKIKKLSTENELLKRIVETKKQEMNILEDEIHRYKGQMDRIDDIKISQAKRIEKEHDEAKRQNSELIEKSKFLEKQMKVLNYQIEQMK